MVTLEGGVGNYIKLKNKDYSYFAGNDYLGLANHPDIIESAALALKKYGVNFSASRQTTGTSQLHLELENQLSVFKNTESAVVFASGYVGNMLLLHALSDQYTAIVADSLAHPSILDGIPRNISSIDFYEHLNLKHLEKLLEKSKTQRSLIITDGIFALTGEIAPLDKIYLLARKYNAIVIVDDAHATGVIGKNGKGTPEHFNLDKEDNLFQSETMSKALGVYGGFITAGNWIVKKIREKSTFYGASTALPPPIVAAGIAAVRIAGRQPGLRDKMQQNARFIRNRVMELGFMTTDSPTPIIPVMFDNAQSAKSLSAFLEENLIIAPSIDYPVKTGNFIVRVTVSANHSRDQIENLLLKLEKWKARFQSRRSVI